MLIASLVPLTSEKPLNEEVVIVDSFFILWRNLLQMDNIHEPTNYSVVINLFCPLILFKRLQQWRVEGALKIDRISIMIPKMDWNNKPKKKKKSNGTEPVIVGNLPQWSNSFSYF